MEFLDATPSIPVNERLTSSSAAGEVKNGAKGLLPGESVTALHIGNIIDEVAELRQACPDPSCPDA